MSDTESVSDLQISQDAGLLISGIKPLINNFQANQNNQTSDEIPQKGPSLIFNQTQLLNDFPATANDLHPYKLREDVRKLIEESKNRLYFIPNQLSEEPHIDYSLIEKKLNPYKRVQQTQQSKKESSEEEEESNDDYYETSQHEQIMETSSLSNSGQAVYKEVNLSGKFSNKPTSEILSTRKEELYKCSIEDPKIILNTTSELDQQQSQPQSKIQKSQTRIQELSSLMPAKTTDISPKKTAQFHREHMESDLKNLQQKILDLENKLQFNHPSSDAEDEPQPIIDLHKNVQFDLQAFHSLNEEIFKISTQPSSTKKQVRIELPQDNKTKQEKRATSMHTVEEERSILKPIIRKTTSLQKIETPKQKTGNNVFGSGRSQESRQESTKRASSANPRLPLRRPYIAPVMSFKPSKVSKAVPISNHPLESYRRMSSLESNVVVHEAAQRVVELQRQLTMMRGKLKQKEKLVTENDFLKAELEELKQKYQESQKRQIVQSKQIEQIAVEIKKVNEEKIAIAKEFKDFKLLNTKRQPLKFK